MKNTLTACALYFLLAGCQKELSQVQPATGPTDSASVVTIHFVNKVNAQPLALSTTSYQNAFGESYTLSACKYYTTNFLLVNAVGTIQYGVNTYHLVDQSDMASLHFSFRCQPDTLLSIAFLIGVDSLQNALGTGGGDLSPDKGMYWSQEAGYLAAKVEGRSPAAATPDHVFRYNISGYSGPYNALRVALLPLPQKLALHAGQTAVITIVANINDWFSAMRALRIADHSECLAPGGLAAQYADNYGVMFTVSSAEVQ